jgi:Raf kinase inhibitor-like YbhB/YbcL family protein
MRHILLAFGLASTLAFPAIAGTPANLQITSTTFANGAPQPTSVAFAACGGSNISPDLHWSGAPADTKSFVLTEFDRDARDGLGFWHWVVADIPASTTGIPAGGRFPASAVAGMTDHGLPGYQGPCPPVGGKAHHYIFTVSALDIPAIPGMTAASTAAFLAASISGHILAQGTYFGTYAR